MRGLRPSAPGVGEGHHDVHAADEVHVHQHDDLRTSEQETQSCLADVELALLTSRSLLSTPVIIVIHQDSQVLSSVQLENKFYQDLK